MFFAQFMIQAGVFFAVPLFLSVVLELNALQTGLRLVPLSIALLLSAAIGIPKLWPARQPAPGGPDRPAAGARRHAGSWSPGWTRAPTPPSSPSRCC